MDQQTIDEVRVTFDARGPWGSCIVSNSVPTSSPDALEVALSLTADQFASQTDASAAETLFEAGSMVDEPYGFVRIISLVKNWPVKCRIGDAISVLIDASAITPFAEAPGDPDYEKNVVVFLRKCVTFGAEVKNLPKWISPEDLKPPRRGS